MRKAWLTPVLVVVSIVLQLTVLNGLRLPGGGVPDLVLVLVAALAVADGPLAGVIVGFAAGLCLDLAPPGSLLIGQYALVFCLAGWAAGRLGRAAGSSPVWAAVFMAIVVAVAEALSTTVGLALEPAQVTTTEFRDVLPATIGYDVVLCPFVLYLVVVAGSLVAEGLAAGAAAGGVPGVPTRWERAQKRRQRQQHPHQPRLVHAAARTGDGWLTSGHDHYRGRQPSTRTRARLRPASGVPGSASGLRHPGSAGSAPRTPTRLRLAGGRRGDGAIGNSVGNGSVGSGGGARWQPGRHPGMLAGASRQFRPRGGQPGGSATRQHSVSRAPAGPGRGTPIRFGGHRGDGTLGRSFGRASLAPSGRPGADGTKIRFGSHRGDGTLGRRFGRASLAPSGRPGADGTKIRFGSHRGDGTLGRSFGRASLAPPGRPAAAVPRLRTGTGRSALTTRGSLPRVVPKVQFRTSAKPAAQRPAAVPRFRRSSKLRPQGSAYGLVSGGVLDQSTFRAVRRRAGTPRLRLATGRRASGRHGAGMLGGSGRSPLSGPRARVGKRPRFGYGRRSLLSFLAGRRVGGRWMARKRVGGRSGVWLIGKRTGGAR